MEVTIDYDIWKLFNSTASVTPRHSKLRRVHTEIGTRIQVTSAHVFFSKQDGVQSSQAHSYILQTSGPTSIGHENSKQLKINRDYVVITWGMMYGVANQKSSFIINQHLPFVVQKIMERAIDFACLSTFRVTYISYFTSVLPSLKDVFHSFKNTF